MRGILYSGLLLAAAGKPAWGASAIGDDDSGAASAGSSGPVTAAPSVLPATGIGPAVRVGDLGTASGHPSFALPSSSPVPAGPAWTVTPSIGLTEEYATGSGSGYFTNNQFITTVEPTLTVTGDTARLQGELSYAPRIALYSRDGSQNRIDQDFNGRLLATLVPQTLFLDLRGTAFVQPVTAGQAPSQINTLNRGNSAQTYSFAASPYALHRFGAWGTAEVGGSVARTLQNALQPAPGQPTIAALADAFNQNVTTTSGHVAFTTGEAFARYSGAALAQTTHSDGSGVLDGAYRDTATLDNGYALTRTITALATIGWERIHYAGTSPIDIDDAIWSLGVRLEPNADSSITLRYGHQDGLNSATLDAAYQPTARTRIYARYSTGLSTQAEQLQNELATSDLDSLGNPVDHTTGAPLVAPGGFFGSQNSVNRTTVASVTGVLLLDRDSVSLSVNNQTQTLVSASNAIGLANGSSRGTYGAVTWAHQLRPDLQSNLYAQYGVQSGGLGSAGVASGDQQSVAISASLSYALSPTLSGHVQYSYDRNYGDENSINRNFSERGSQSLVLVSLVKSF